MSTATIDVRFVDPPKDGKKQWTIKTADGSLYGVWPDKAGLFQPGRRYEIEFSERPFNGKTFRTVVKCRLSETPKAAGPTNTTASDEHLVGMVLAAGVQAGLIEFTEQSLTHAIGTIRNAYRRSLS